MGFIEDFIDFTKAFESPTNFWRWSAYAGIAAVLRDNTYYDHGLRKTYPNIFVVLLADSAEYRKSGPFDPIRQMLTHESIANTKIISGRTSIQSIMDDLSQDTASGKGSPIRGGSSLLIADELASFFVQDPQLIPLLTDMYDYRDQFQYNLKSGKVVIKKLCMTFLAASNETFLREVYTQAAVYGGLLGRTFMVKPDKRRKANSLLDVDPAQYNFSGLIDKLKEIKKLNGKFTTNAKDRESYEKWYDKLYASYTNNPDRTGVTQRIHTGALKLAMILAANDLTLEISEKHFEEAIYRVNDIRPNYGVYTMSTGKSEQAEIGALFLDQLWHYKGLATRKQILLKHWQDFSADQLDELIKTLEGAGLINCTFASHDTTYEMTSKCRELFERKLS